jgi:hypothetical protein
MARVSVQNKEYLNRLSKQAEIEEGEVIVKKGRIEIPLKDKITLGPLDKYA